MGNRADFELEAVLALLERAAQGYAPGSEESSAMDVAARALHFIAARDELDDEFREHLEMSDRPAADVIRVEQEFPSIDDARRWLDALDPPRAGTLVSIAGTTHVVSRRSVDHWFFVRTLSPQELDAPPEG